MSALDLDAMVERAKGTAVAERETFGRAFWHAVARKHAEDVLALTEEVRRWLAWSDGRYPDDSPGHVIHAEADGTVTLDDGVTTWNPLRALAALAEPHAAISFPRPPSSSQRDQP